MKILDDRAHLRFSPRQAGLYADLLNLAADEAGHYWRLRLARWQSGQTLDRLRAAAYAHETAAKTARYGLDRCALALPAESPALPNVNAWRKRAAEAETKWSKIRAKIERVENWRAAK